jgi:hypothetical protein
VWLGVALRLAARAATIAPRRRRVSTKTCPYCSETIQEAAIKCRFCNESLRDDDRPPVSRAGAGAGVVTIIIVVSICALLGFVGLVAAIAIPNLIEARKSGNEASAIGCLKTITTAEVMHLEADKDMDGVRDYGTLAELGNETLIDPVLATGRRQGYVFTISTAAGTGRDAGLPRFAATADPQTPGTTGDRYFGVDETGAIYYSVGRPFSVQNGVLTKPAGASPLGR